MNLVRLLLEKSWLTGLLAVGMGMLSGASSTALVALSNNLLAGGLVHDSRLLFGFIGLCVLLVITNITSQVMVARLAEGAVFQLRLNLSRRILASPLSQLEQTGSARLLATLSEDIQLLASAFFAFPFVCTNIAIFLSCLAYLLWLSWPVFLVMVGVLLVAVVSLQVFIVQANRSFSQARAQQDKLFGHYRSITEGVKELKLHSQRRHSFLTEDLYKAASDYRRYGLRGITIFSVGSSWGLAAIFIAIGILLFVVPRIVPIEPQVLSGYMLIIFYMVLPLSSVLSAFPAISRATISLQAIDALGLSLASDAAESNAAVPTLARVKQLELRGITHTYYQEREESNFILGPIQLTLNAGELVFVIGGNGSGKSTLAKLITGLYSPESGSILLDQQPISDLNREWYRQHFSVIFSDFYLFDRLLGLGDLDPQAQQYLKLLQLDHKVQIQDGQISTTSLSQGQRKRLALLTAYLEDRPIYLFDEWASDQDPLFKDIFYTQLLPDLKRKGKMILAITHDDRYFHLADRLIKLEYGQIEYDRSPTQEGSISPH